MRKLPITALAFAALTLGLPAQGRADMEVGLAAVDRGDYAAALGEFQAQAEQGNATAQFFLGVMYNKGKGVTQDYHEAVKWYQKAAEQGHAKAQFNLGVMFDDGKGVAHDYAEAVKWYRKAALQGDAKAQFSYGYMHASGNGVSVDYVTAVMWFEIAAANPSPAGRGINGLVEGTREIVEAKMTPQQVAEAKRRARDWSTRRK